MILMIKANYWKYLFCDKSSKLNLNMNLDKFYFSKNLLLDEQKSSITKSTIKFDINRVRPKSKFKRKGSSWKFVKITQIINLIRFKASFICF